MKTENCPKDARLYPTPIGSANESDAIEKYKKDWAIKSPSSPQILDEAFCQKGDQYYLRLDRYDPQTSIIEKLKEEITRSSIEISLYDNKIIPEWRGYLAETIKTVAALKNNKSENYPVEDFFLEVGRNALLFGAITSLGQDGLYSLNLISKNLKRITYLYERDARLKHLASQPNACGEITDNLPEIPYFPWGEVLKLGWRSATAGITLLGSSIYGGRKATDYYREEKMQSILNASKAGSEEQKTIAIPFSQNLDSISSISELEKLNQNQKIELSKLKEEKDRIGNYLKKTFKDLYALHLKELRNQDVNELADEKLKAIATELQKRNALANNSSWLDNLKKPVNALEIGLGFGAGTLVVRKFFHYLFPWRVKIDRMMNEIDHQAEKDARKIWAEECRKKATPKTISNPFALQIPQSPASYWGITFKQNLDLESSRRHSISFIHWGSKLHPDREEHLRRKLDEFNEAVKREDFAQAEKIKQKLEFLYPLYLDGKSAKDENAQTWLKGVGIGIASFVGIELGVGILGALGSGTATGGGVAAGSEAGAVIIRGAKAAINDNAFNFVRTTALRGVATANDNAIALLKLVM